MRKFLLAAVLFLAPAQAFASDAVTGTSCGNGSAGVGNTQQVMIDQTDALCVAHAAWTYKHIVGAATTVVKGSGGALGAIVINKPISLSVTTIYDNTAGSGTVIGVLTNPLALLQQQNSLMYGSSGVAFATGLTIVTSAGDDLTVVYK